MSTPGVRAMMMRGGTSKGLYFLAEDLPSTRPERDDLLLRLMGSPDPRQIDGLGGAHPLTSKVAVVAPPSTPDADIDYLFLQVQVDEPLVSDQQTCGNIIAGVGPFAIERGLVPVRGEFTDVRINTLNGNGGVVVARVSTPGGEVEYAGTVTLSGAPFGAAPIALEYPASDTSLLPTGHVRDEFDGVAVTCVDAGMPVVLIRAEDLGVVGDESPTSLEENSAVTQKVERIRLLAGPAMGLGDVTDATVPKMSIVSAPGEGGSIRTRTFIPRRVHTSIGVVGAISVAAGAQVPGSVAADLFADIGRGPVARIEHPTGYFDVEVEVAERGDSYSLARGAVVRTARKLFDGTVWPRESTD